ncbi:MAG TPA: 4-hydroxybenzoate octaprenyltransferase [Gammaproteobacteria bacterium]|nr:4-hydroxybenzoate octaprenyltransferase [Gammaproteobacteria bacterium]
MKLSMARRWKRLTRTPLVRRRLPAWRKRLCDYAQLMRLDKPIGIYLLLWPTLWALWIAGEGHPRADVFVVFVLGVVCMRSAGCIINDLADRKMDPHVWRTKHRPLAAGRLKVKHAVGLFILLVLAAFALVLTQNRLTIYLSFAGLALAIIYPFMKRIMWMPQAVLGMSFGWAIPMAFAAQTGTVPPLAWLLFCTNILWSIIYDTMYAMADRPDDLKIGVKSSAILFGDLDKLIIFILQLVMLGALYLVGERAQLGPAYTWSLLIGAGIMLYHQWLIRNRDLHACFHAFLHNHWFGMVIFIGIALSYVFADA